MRCFNHIVEFSRFVMEFVLHLYKSKDSPIAAVTWVGGGERGAEGLSS